MFVQRIQELHGDSDKAEVTSLDLEGLDATNLEGLTDDFGNLSSLSLANNKISSLKAFPTLKTLTSLNLSNNSLDGGLDHLAPCAQLKTLDLSNNQFSSVDHLEPLKQCESLETLKLAGCPIASTEDYQAAVFEMLPHVSTVDGHSRTKKGAGKNKNGSHANGTSVGATVNGEGDTDAAQDEAGVDQLLRDDLEDDDEEYCPEGEEEEDDDEIDEDEDDDEEEGDYEEEDATAEPRGVKRKHEDDDPVSHADDNPANGTH